MKKHDRQIEVLTTLINMYEGWIRSGVPKCEEILEVLKEIKVTLTQRGQ